jgi:hypothetical protein
MREYANEWDREIKGHGAAPLFYLTWARKSAPETQAGLTESYSMCGEDVGADVAPVGVARANALKAHPGLTLHQGR